MALAGAARDMTLVTRAFNDHWSVCTCVCMCMCVNVAGETGLNHQGRVKETYYTHASHFIVTELHLQILLSIFNSGFLQKAHRLKYIC